MDSSSEQVDVILSHLENQDNLVAFPLEVKVKKKVSLHTKAVLIIK